MTNLLENAQAISSWKKEADTSYYTGAYVEEMMGVVMAAIVVNGHLNLNSLPGWGKTEMTRVLASRMVGEAHVGRVEFMPVTDPADVKGGLDAKAYFDDGQRVLNQVGTVYDKGMRVMVFDEMFRDESGLGTGAALHAMDKEKQNHCVVISTNNWLPAKGDTKHDALLDRATFTYHLNPSLVPGWRSIGAALLGAQSMDFPFHVPENSWNTILEARQASRHLGTNAKAALIDLVESLGGDIELVNQGGQLAADLGLTAGCFAPAQNPRTVVQMVNMLATLSVWFSGSTEFNSIPVAARRFLRWVYPARTYGEMMDWRKFVDQVAINDAFEAYRSNIEMDFFNDCMAVANIADTTGRMKEVQDVARKLRKIKRDLSNRYGTDPRAASLSNTYDQWLQAAQMGDKTSIGDGGNF